MVKSVLAEETRLKLTEDGLFQAALPVQVGLVIGKLSSSLDKGFVFDLIPTPANDAGEPACSLLESGKDDRKKGSKTKTLAEASLLVIDKDWVDEHARQGDHLGKYKEMFILQDDCPFLHQREHIERVKGEVTFGIFDASIGTLIIHHMTSVTYFMNPRRVSRLLLGGVNVIGIYIWAAESSFKTSTTILWQTVKIVADAAQCYESDLDERLLIHISFSPRRWSCRNCKLGSTFSSSSLRPCDFKMGKVLPSLHTFKCMYNFEMRLPIFCADASKAWSFGDALRSGITSHAKELRDAKALVDGNLVVGDQPSTSDTAHEVDLLLPFTKDATKEARSTEEVMGIVVVSGAIFSSAYLCPKEPISQAISDIKVDIINSLRSRLDILCDVSEEENSRLKVDKEGKFGGVASPRKPAYKLPLHDIRKPCNLLFPRRILVPWLPGICICDYLQSSDSIQDLKDQWKELLLMDAPSDMKEILEPEAEAISLSTKSFWDFAHGNPKSESNGSQMKEIKDSKRSTETKRHYFNILIALALLLFSVLMGSGLMFLSR